MEQDIAKALLARAGAIVEGHFVGTSGKHLSVYVTKDTATKRTSIVRDLCSGIAHKFVDEKIDVVVAPAIGGIPLSQWTAYHLTNLHPGRPEILALYSEHDDSQVMDINQGALAYLGKSTGTRFQEGDKLFHRRTGFVLKRGFADDVKGKHVLVVEDVLTTGGSARKTVEAVKAAGGIVVGLGVLANGGKVTAEACGVNRLEALVNVERQVFTPSECLLYNNGLCRQGIPINTEFGHGKEYLASLLTEQL